MMHLVGEPAPESISPRDGGVRKNFYRLRGHQGVEPYVIEDTSSGVETRALPLLRGARERWPLDDLTKGTLAHFISLQLVRGPGWRRHHEIWAFEEDAGLPGGIPAAGYRAEVEAYFCSDLERNKAMLGLVTKVASALGHALDARRVPGAAPRYLRSPGCGMAAGVE
jgi:hypothetical protein